MSFLSKNGFDEEKMQGYGKSFWGMTPSQVVSAENGRAHLLNPPVKYHDAVGTVGIDKVEIGQHEFKVVYQFTDDRLTRVIVQTIEDKNAEINKQAFSNVELLLTQKYGQPIFKNEGKNVVWNQPGTTIDLSHLLIEDVMSLVTCHCYL